MKIGIDLHGTLDKDHEIENFLKIVMKGFYSKGVEFIIISGGKDRETIKNKLDKLHIIHGIHYHKIISIPEYLINKGIEMKYDDNGNPWCDDEIWWNSKGMVCNELKIDIMVDDKEKYKPNFKNKKSFVLFDDLKKVYKERKENGKI